MNEDASSEKLAERWTKLGLKDLILSTHRSSFPPATFNRNNIQISINVIWGNSSIKVISASYEPFD